jgi:hypothetical protein
MLIHSKTSEIAMTLENTLRTRLAEPPPAGQQGPTIPHGDWSVTLRPEAHDALSCSLWELAARRAVAAGGDPRAWAERVSRTATGLLEPLRLLEVDAARRIALLRSAPPSEKDAGPHYYEVELHGTTEATVRRFRGSHDPARKREQVPFTLTYEVLGKLIGDLTAGA